MWESVNSSLLRESVMASVPSISFPDLSLPDLSNVSLPHLRLPDVSLPDLPLPSRLKELPRPSSAALPIIVGSAGIVTLSAALILVRLGRRNKLRRCRLAAANAFRRGRGVMRANRLAISRGILCLLRARSPKHRAFRNISADDSDDEEIGKHGSLRSRRTRDGSKGNGKHGNSLRKADARGKLAKERASGAHPSKTGQGELASGKKGCRDGSRIAGKGEKAVKREKREKGRTAEKSRHRKADQESEASQEVQLETVQGRAVATPTGGYSI